MDILVQGFSKAGILGSAEVSTMEISEPYPDILNQNLQSGPGTPDSH